MNSLAVDIKNLCFTYPGQSAMLFSDLNLTIGAGERFGLFGPNGAGKTTLMNLMTGLLSFEQGSIRLSGNEIKKKGKSISKICKWENLQIHSIRYNITIATNYISLQLPNNEIADSIFVTDLTGKIFLEVTQDTNQLNIENLDAGVYLIVALLENKKYQNKFIKN